MQGLRFAVDMDIQLLINCIGALVLWNLPSFMVWRFLLGLLVSRAELSSNHLTTDWIHIQQVVNDFCHTKALLSFITFYAENLCVVFFFSFVAEIKNILFMYIDSFLFFLCVLAVTCICGFKCSRYISCPHVPFCEIYSFLASRGLVTLFLGDIVAQVFFLPFL